MLDLTTAFNENLYEIKLFDGTVLKLKRPTQAIQQTLMSVIPLLEKEEDQMKMIPVIAQLFRRVLNRNDQNRMFTEQELSEEYDFAIMTYVVQDYFIYWNKEVANKVNFQNSQQ